MPIILLVEDDRFLSEMYTAKLKQAGFEVILATDGEEAFKKTNEIKPALILSNVIMPKMDGFELLEKIKKDPTLSAIKFVFLTNMGQKEDVEKGMLLGADDYIIQAHFSPAEVADKANKLLNERKN